MIGLAIELVASVAPEQQDLFALVDPRTPVEMSLLLDPQWLHWMAKTLLRLHLGKISSDVALHRWFPVETLVLLGNGNGLRKDHQTEKISSSSADEMECELIVLENEG